MFFLKSTIQKNKGNNAACGESKSVSCTFYYDDIQELEPYYFIRKINEK